MVSGVCCSMTIVLAVMGFLITASAYLFSTTIFFTLDLNYLTPEDDAAFILLANNVANQVQLWQDIVFEDIDKLTLIIDEMINPTYFEKDLSNFPLQWDDVKTWTVQEILEDDPDSVIFNYDEEYQTETGLSLQHVIYVSSAQKSENIINFEKIITQQNYLWESALYTGYGLDGNVQTRSITWFFFDQQADRCDMTVLFYPAIDFTTTMPWLTQNFENEASCTDYSGGNYDTLVKNWDTDNAKLLVLSKNNEYTEDTEDA